MAMTMYEAEPCEACHDTEMLFDSQEEATVSWVGGQGAGGVTKVTQLIHMHPFIHEKIV